MNNWLARQIAAAQQRLEGIEPERLDIIRRKYAKPEPDQLRNSACEESNGSRASNPTPQPPLGGEDA